MCYFLSGQVHFVSCSPAEHEVEHLRVVLLLELAQDLGGAAELAPALLEAGVLQVDVQLVRQVVRRGPTVHVADLGNDLGFIFKPDTHHQGLGHMCEAY